MNTTRKAYGQRKHDAHTHDKALTINFIDEWTPFEALSVLTFLAFTANYFLS